MLPESTVSFKLASAAPCVKTFGGCALDRLGLVVILGGSPTLDDPRGCRLPAFPPRSTTLSTTGWPSLDWTPRRNMRPCGGASAIPLSSEALAELAELAELNRPLRSLIGRGYAGTAGPDPAPCTGETLQVNRLHPLTGRDRPGPPGGPTQSPDPGERAHRSAAVCLSPTPPCSMFDEALSHTSPIWPWRWSGRSKRSQRSKPPDRRQAEDSRRRQPAALVLSLAQHPSLPPPGWEGG
jgi:hypothetical protein